MRKLLLSILSLFAFAIAANAAEVTFDLTSGYTNQQEVSSVSSDGVTLTFDKGTNSNTPKWYTTGTAVRLYGGSTLTVSSTVGKVTSVVFTFSGTGYTLSNTATATVDNGSYSESGTTGTWTLSATNATITRGGTSGHARIKKVVVTVVSDGSLAAPTFSVAGGTYYQAKTVEIANANGSGKVYYTTNGDDPTAESTEYTAPIEITATTTLKAVVIDGDKSSEITSATYTIETPVEVANIAEYLTKDDNAVVKFTNPVTAFYQNGIYLYVKDETGEALIYGSVGQTYENGDVIPAGFFGTKKYYNGIYELDAAVSDGSFKASTEKVTPIVAAEKKLADITAANVHQYVFLKGVTYDATNKKFTDADGGELAVYNRFNGITLPVAGEYDVYGIVSVFQKTTDDPQTIQLYPTEFVSKVVVDNIADFKALGVGGIAKINCPLTVTAVYTTKNNYVNYYVQDEAGDGIVIYGAVADLPTYEAKDIIPAGFTGTYAEHNGLPEIIDCEGLAASTEPGTIVAAGCGVEDLATDQICKVVELQGTEILDISGSNFNIKDETGTVAAYNKFSLERIEAYTGLKIVGIVDVYNGKIQILPIEIDYTNGTAEEAEINADDDIVVSTGEGSIIVDGGDVIQIVTPDGRATTVKGSGDTPDRRRRIIETENGIYIVVVDGEVVEKVYVE